MRVLGLVANTHDSGLALLTDGVPDIVLEEERFNRQKKTKRFPRLALAHAFDERGLDIADVDAIVTPWDIGRLRKTVASVLLKGFPQSLNLLHQRAHKGQRNQIVFLNRYLEEGLREHFGARLGGNGALPPIVNVGHHESHAAAFFVSPFEEAAILVMDGYGDEYATSVYLGRGNRIERLWGMDVLNSLGLVYTFITQFLGFQAFHDEGKVMGLAAYGGTSFVDKFRNLVKLTPDGRYKVDKAYFSYDRFGQIQPFKEKFYAEFGAPRQPGEELTQRHRDIAFGLQAMLEECVLHVVRGIAAQVETRNLVIVGGVALNCVANARVLAETPFKRLWVPPSASDSGTPLGAALWHWHQNLDKPRHFELTHAYWGRQPTDKEMIIALDAAGVRHKRLSEPELIARTAADIAAGKIVGWYQGRCEIGPRALGNRSILADPRRAEMKDIINARIKHREAFRPFAPAVPVERAAEYFHIDHPDPFMTVAPKVRAEKAAEIPAVVHADGTGRIQTVSHNANPRYHKLITEFGRITGVPVLLNTSFNKQEPVVSRAEEAVSCFLRTEMDVLVLGDHYCIDHNPDAVQRAIKAFSVVHPSM